jgi:hypothetical protein
MSDLNIPQSRTAEAEAKEYASLMLWCIQKKAELKAKEEED